MTLSGCSGGQKPSGPPVAPQEAATQAVPAAPPATPQPAPVPEPRALATISGTVTYRLRIALTPEAQVQVELRDVSLQDVEAPLIAKQVIEKPGQVPIPFTLEYDPSAIQPGRTYAVSARISDRGQLRFVTDTRIPVLSNGAPTSVEIVVVPVR